MTAGDPFLDVAPARGSWVRVPLQAARVHAVAAGLFAALVALNLVDLVSTLLVLDRGGEEGNPVMAPIVHNMFGALALKVACLALIGALIARSRRSTRMMLVVAAVDAWYLLVILWNVHVLRMLA